MPCTSSSLSYRQSGTISIDFKSLLLFLQPGYMLFLELFDTVLMKSTKIHSSLQTLTHNLTPPSPQKLPLNIPIVSKFHPNLPHPINDTASWWCHAVELTLFLWHMPDDATEGVAEHSSDLQQSINLNLHAPVQWQPSCSAAVWPMYYPKG